MGNSYAPVLWFDDLRREDVPQVGGKNASLGEMVSALGKEGIKVPPGFATAAEAYRDFVAANDLDDVIRGTLDDLESGKVAAEADRM